MEILELKEQVDYTEYYLMQKLSRQYHMIKNRERSGEPLRAEEITVTIPTSDYKQLLEYSLRYLVRHAPVPPLTGFMEMNGKKKK